MEKLFDCVIQQGQLDKSDCPSVRYLDNEHYKCEVILHNVTQAEAITWVTGPGLKLANEIEEQHLELFPYYHASAFWTDAIEN